MSRETQLNHRTLTDSQELYLPIAVSAFLLDRKVQNMSTGTLQFYQVKLYAFLAFCEGQLIKSLDQLTPDVIRQYLLSMESSGHNAGGIHAAYRTLRTFLNWYEREYEPEGWRNPIRKVKAPRLPQEPLEPVSRDDFDSLVDTCDRSWYGVRDKAILLTLLDSGVRAQELCNLNLSDLESSGALEVRQGKGRKPRVVFVGSTTRKALRQWLKRRGIMADPLFTTREGERLTYSGLRQIVRRRAELAGIDAPGLHDFRRAFCLAQLQAGVPETAIARIMGHTTTQLIARYAKQVRGDLQQLYRSPVDGD